MGTPPILMNRRAPTHDRVQAIRAPIAIVGAQGVVPRSAPISTAQRTVIAPRLARRLGGAHSRIACTRSALGAFCGVTQEVNVAINGCDSVRVHAIVAPIDRAIGDAVIGHDVLSKAQAVLTFGRRLHVQCPRRQR